MRKLLVAISIMVAVFNNVQAQDAQYIQNMEAALAIHDTASNVASEIKGLNAFRKLSDKYDNEWLPSYWTAYLCTQVARLKGRSSGFPENLDPKALVHEAQVYFDKASANLPDKNDVQQSDFHALQGFIHNWNNWIVATTREEKDRFDALAKKEFKLAAWYNHENPLLYVLIGINLTGKDREYREVLAGIALLNYASEIFERAPHKSMTTYWTKDFISYWKSLAEKKLKELLQEKDA